MEVVKLVKGLTIVKKRNGRFGVKNAKGKWVNAEEKVKVLLGEGLIAAPVAKKAPAKEEVAEEAPAADAPAE